jgi:hypothetical protein
MQKQAPAAVLMVRPLAFGYNAEAALTNRYAQPPDRPAEDIRTQAIAEFDRMVDLLRAHDVAVHVYDNETEPASPDAVFPNNWVSFHADGTVVLYPMCAPVRRTERRPELLTWLGQHYRISRVIDLSHFEQEHKFLEGTGSVVFDYIHRKAYAARSARTHEDLILHLCRELGYEPVVFDALEEGLPVYHTNVMLTIASRLVLICLDAVQQESHQEMLLAHLHDTGRKIIALSHAQVRAFAGNMMEVQTRQGQPLLVMSDSAYCSLVPGQLDFISREIDILVVPVPTLERYGGGSVRCMMAGIFNPAA